MSWNKALLSLVVILLYIPLVFMGANVFFPEYTDYDYDYYDHEGCLIQNSDTSTETFNQTCVDEKEKEEEAYETARNEYNANKYIFIIILNLLVLFIALYINLEESVAIGLFLGSTLTSFFSTWIFFDTKSKIGFLILLLIFFTSIFFITKKKKIFNLK